MLIVHETHTVKGERERDFEAAYRDDFLSILGRTEDARLLWYFNHAHGSGRSYTAVTVTAFANAAAWERFARRVQSGDCRDWIRGVDELRHGVRVRLLCPLPWSPMHDLELTDVATDGREHDLAMYMQDTMWPRRGRLNDYIEAAGSTYRKSLESDEAVVDIRIQAALQSAPGGGTRPEVTLMQKIFDHEQLLWLLTHDLPETTTGPGTWMHTALEYRDQWESKLLRTARWSPLN